MELIVNGKSYQLEKVDTIDDVIQHFGLQEKIVVVELNREIVPRERYCQQGVHEGDRIEIVHFVGGGR